MSIERFQRARRLFHLLCELPADQRTKLLEQECAGDAELREEVASLLEHHDSDPEALGESKLGLGASLLADAGESVPERIGRYRIIRKLGEGGMGTVFEAVQQNPERMVALKVIKAPFASRQLLRRFEHEAHILGQLQHPGIAQVYEAGTAETPFGERPYIAMELVRGRSLTQYADAHGLGTRQRLEIIARVCDAVHHAHLRGVVHRDLKPSNVLVVEESDEVTKLRSDEVGATDGGRYEHTDVSGSDRLAEGDVARQGGIRGDGGDAGQRTVRSDRADAEGGGLDSVEHRGGARAGEPGGVSSIPEDRPGVADGAADADDAGRGAWLPGPGDGSEDDAGGDRSGPPGIDPQRRPAESIERISAQITEAGSADTTEQHPKPSADHQTVPADRRPAKRSAGRFRRLSTSSLRHSVISSPSSAQPKILDFGVARLTNADVETVTLRTDIGQLVGTIPYMSPEQLAGDSRALDNRSDVYALGVVCFELLSGRLPHDVRNRTIPEAARLIREEEPLRLSTIAPTLRGDIDTIVSKALEKDRDRRYPSAAVLAADIRRYLNDEPIVARPPSTAYYLRKLVRRNRALAIGSAAFLLALIVGLVATTWFAIGEARQRRLADEARRQAGQEAERATREARTAQQVSEFLVDLFRVSDPSEARGNTITARQILDRGAERIDRELADQPAVQSRLMALIAEVYRNLGIVEPATPLLESALETQLRLYGPDHLETLKTRRLLARQVLDRGDFKTAETMFREVLDTRRRELGNDHMLIAESAGDLTDLYMRTGRIDEAEELLHEIRRILTEKGDTASDELAACLHNLAGIALARGDYRAAKETYAESVEMRRSVEGPDHPAVAMGLSALGLAQRNLGEYEAAEATLREALALGRKLWGEDNSNLGPILNNLALTLQNLGKYGQAEPLMRQLLEIDRRDFGERHPYVAGDLSNLGVLLQDMGDLQGAEAVLLEALEMQRALLGDEHSSTLMSVNNLASLYQAQGRLDEAEPLYRESLETRTRVLGEDHPLTLTSKGNLAIHYLRRENPAMAESKLTEALETARRVLGAEHPRTVTLMKNLGKVYERQERYAEAEPLFVEALEVRRRTLGPEHPDTVLAVADIGGIHAKQGRYAEAEEILLEEYELRKQTVDGSVLEPVIEALVETYDAAGRKEDAAAWRAKLPNVDTPSGRQGDTPGDE